MLMPVQFPGDFAVAHLREIQVANLEPRLPWRPLVVHLVAVPVNFRPVIQVFVTQEIKIVTADPLRLLHDRFNIFGKTLL